ncbi:glycosyltransferase family 4 protein [uncultured Algoriphagus sp.]|uniref:glycosyltransferase family 4 protein n=1 Tax=uncultured Algoriphagus sp. TaxID=417365 RepID=UPI0030EE9B9C
MKILFIDTEPIRRGAQIFISELSSFLDPLGHRTKIVYLYQLKNDSDDSIALSPNVTYLHGKKDSTFEKMPGVDPVLIRKLLKEINIFSPDVIVANGSRTLKYSASARHFYRGDALWVARWIDDAEFWNPGIASKLMYSKLILPQFDACIAVSQASLDSMIRHYNFKKPGIVIHRVFDRVKFNNAPTREDARRKLGLDNADEVLLFLGNLSPQKRPDRFLESIQKLNETRPHLKALIVGDGPLRKELEKEVLSIENQESGDKNQEWGDKNQEASSEESSVFYLPSSVNPHPTPVGEGGLNIGHRSSVIGHRASNIFFSGYQKDVSPYLSAADILVLTSDTEGLPGVVLEAAYFEVPTVATEVGGIKECLIDGETGYLIPDRSVDAFCQKINLLFDYPHQRIQLGINAKKFTSEHFQMEKVAKQYLDFFRQTNNHY